MKRLLLTLLIFNFQFSIINYVGAQTPTTLDGWAQRLKLFGEKIPQEEVFIHMDNTCYYLGDTLYYKAYMRLADGRPSTLSHLLYVELLNNDGYLVERQKVEMKGGEGYGSFVLLDTLYGGYYELRAYTRWQLNWGEYEHPHTRFAEDWFYSKRMARDYYRDYDKLYSRVFPVYDKPRKAGEYYQDMTMRPMRRQLKESNNASKAVVTFYPEGGNLVAGAENRVAFEANTEDGKHLNGSLSLTLPQGKGMIETKTENRGRGTFLLDLRGVPVDDVPEKCTFTWEGGSQEFHLPKAVGDGLAIRTTVEADGIHVKVDCCGTACNDSLGLTVTSHGVLKNYQKITGDEQVIPMDKLSTGVVQLTVFNPAGRIYADRLVFVRKPDFQPQSIRFEGAKVQYEPYEQVNLGIQCAANDSPSISLAVRDAIHSDYTFDSGNILTEMLLSSQIRGFVENPEYFFEADDEEHRRALDLLLMVQGWRRYDWHTMTVPGAFILAEPYERTEVLMGEVCKYEAVRQADAIMEAMDKREAERKAEMEEKGYEYAGPDLEEDLYDKARKGNRDKDPNSNAALEDLMKKDQQRMAQHAESRQGNNVGTNAAATDDRKKVRNKGEYRGSLSKEVMVHAEFAQPGAKEGERMVEGEMTTYNNGLFKVVAPHFYGPCLMHFAAVDEDKYKGEKHVWVNGGEDRNGEIRYPDYYVRLRLPYPRFVKPYSFYQKVQPAPRVREMRRLHTEADAIIMDEVTVGAARRGLRAFDASKPAFVLDAYEAFNATCEAGFCPGYYIGSNRFAYDIARTYIGDMNMERNYEIEQRFESKGKGSYMSAALLEKYNHLPRLDMVYVYTDYSPRREGDKRYSQSNQPYVTVDLRRFADEGQRMTWVNRFMVLTGYAVCEDFYQPDYSKQKPAQPTDYRRTLYWNPNVKLDAEGKANVTFYNNSRRTQLTLSAEGMTSTGQPLTGISYPEDR